MARLRSGIRQLSLLRYSSAQTTGIVPDAQQLLMIHTTISHEHASGNYSAPYELLRVYAFRQTFVS